MKKTFFKINIYEPELKKEKGIKGPSSGQYLGIFSFISFLLLFLVVLYLFFILYLPQKNTYEAMVNKKVNSEKRLQALISKAKELERKKEAYLTIRCESINWLEKMVVLGEVVPENVWFSRFEFPGRNGDQKGGQKLLIYGSTFSGFREENLDQIGILLTKLNHASEYKKDFSPLHLNFTQKSEDDWGITMFQYTANSTDLTANAH